METFPNLLEGRALCGGIDVNKRQITNKIEKAISNWIASITSESVQRTIQDHGFVAGGSIVSMLKDAPVNDYDVYFRNRNAAKAVAEYYIEKFKERNPDAALEVVMEDNSIYVKTPHRTGVADKDFDLEEEVEIREGVYRPLYISPNAISLSDKIQVIVKFFGEPAQVVDKFDFAHTKCYWSYRNGLVLDPKAVECILTNELLYCGSDYPITAMARVRKFLERGWNINAGQFLKLAYDVHELDLTDPDVLTEQLVGVDVSLFHAMIREFRRELGRNPDLIISPEYINGLVDRFFKV